MNKKILSRILPLLIIFALVLTACSSPQKAKSDASHTESKTIRILATSDLHGKMYPWDYLLNEESMTGSMPQLATAIKEFRNEHTLLVDAGDTIHGNAANIFIDEEIHPMMRALNALDYEIWVSGNHEYDYPMDVLMKAIHSFNGCALTGNVRDTNGDPIADGCTIIEKGGVRIAVIGMVTPNIQKWSASNLKGFTVTDPVEESRKIIDTLQGQYDILLGVMHMDIENEYGVKNSGVTDLAYACPEFDVIIASHGHRLIEGMDINGALVVENKNQAQTMSVIDLTVEKEKDDWCVTDKTAQIINIADYEPDQELMDVLAPYDKKAKIDAESVIAEFDGEYLVPPSENDTVPSALIQDTALADLITNTMMYYADTEVSASSLSSTDVRLVGNKMRKCDVSQFYRYENTLYKIRMNVAQLKKYMEWSALLYNQFEPGDTSVSFNPGIATYNYDIFTGVNYEINIANEPGSRIQNLTWPDGSAVRDSDSFTIAVNSYRAGSHLLNPGVIFAENDMPELLEADVRSDLGGIREMILEYITDVKGGRLIPECDNNWKITGTG